MNNSETNTLQDFCEWLTLAYHYEQYADIRTETIAEHFCEYFGIDFLLDYDYLVQHCQQFGIEDIEERGTLGKCRGYHHFDSGGYHIFVRRQDWKGSKEHTILHEIYEIINRYLVDIDQSFEAKGMVLEIKADKFAACVLMPKNQFEHDMFETGLDIYQLRKSYDRAYSSVLIRMNSLLQDHFSFFGLIYEPECMIENPNIKPDRAFHAGEFVSNYLVNTCDLTKKNKKRYYIWKCIPVKGQLLSKDCIGYQVLQRRDAVMRVFSGEQQNLFGNDDFILLGRPIYWDGIIVKIIVMGIPIDKKEILQPQIKNLCPVELGEVGGI